MTLVQDRIIPLAGKGDGSALQILRSGDQATLVTAIRDSLSSLSNTTVSASQTEEATAEDRYQSTRMWAIGMLLVCGYGTRCRR